MKHFESHFELFLFSLFFFVPFLPELGVIDIIGIQHFYLSIVNSLILIYLFIKRGKFGFNVIGLSNPGIITFFTFIILYFIVNCLYMIF